MNTKRCPACGLILPITEFYWNDKAQRCKVGKCKKCWAIYVKQYKANRTKAQRSKAQKKDTEWARRDRAANPDKWYLRWMRTDLKKKFGVTIEWYGERLAAQGGVCAICGKSNSSGRRLAVDHCHKTKSNRGLLCSPCNTSLERMESMMDWHEKALAYLAHYAAVS